MSTRYTAYAGKEIAIIIAVSLAVCGLWNMAKIIVLLGWFE